MNFILPILTYLVGYPSIKIDIGNAKKLFSVLDVTVLGFPHHFTWARRWCVKVIFELGVIQIIRCCASMDHDPW